MAIGLNECLKMYNSGVNLKTIAPLFGVSQSQIYKIFKANNWTRSHSEANRIHSLNSDFFKKIDSEAKAYFLGLLYADGSVCYGGRRRASVRLFLHAQDVHIIESFKKCLGYSGDIKDSRGYKYLMVNSKKLVEDLISVGCIPNKTHKLRLPKINKTLMRHFIRGVFDGDGSVFFNKRGRIKFCISGHLPFLIELAKHLPVPNRRYIDKRTPQHGSITVEAKDHTAKLFTYFYKNSNYFLKRKYKKWGGVSL